MSSRQFDIIHRFKVLQRSSPHDASLCVRANQIIADVLHMAWAGAGSRSTCTRSSPHAVHCAVTRHCGVAGINNLMKRSVLNARILPHFLPGQKVVLLAREEGSAQKPLPFSQRFGQRMPGGLGQQWNANDAEQSAACEDDVVKEEAFLVVKFHKWSSQHAKPGASQDQTYTSTPNTHINTKEQGYY